MYGADIVMGWLDQNGTPTLSDRHAVRPGTPIVDDVQNVELISISETNGVTTMHFRRQLAACDKDDLAIVGTARILVAFGREKPIDGVPDKHGDADRVQISLTLVNGAEPPIPTEDDLFTIDFVFENARWASENTKVFFSF